MELQTPRYKPQDIGASSCLEIIGKLVSQFKRGHTTAYKRSIFSGNDLIPNTSESSSK